MTDVSEQTLVSLLEERYSCRGYRPEPVPRATIERILQHAQYTASWCNAQPWQVHLASVTRTDELRSALLAHAESHEGAPDFAFPVAYNGVYQQRRRECGFQLYHAVGVARGDHAARERQRLENYRFFGAPHVAVISTEADLGIYGAVDCGAYVQNFMLAARAYGVASIAQAALALYPDFWRAQFGLSEIRKIVCGISFGYADSEHPANAFRTLRADQGQVVQWLE